LRDHPCRLAYCEGFDLVHWREATRSNGIWQVDHAPLSILLILEDGQTARPWLTVVIDDYGRAIAGYDLGFDPYVVEYEHGSHFGKQ
jgi:putative transposase